MKKEINKNLCDEMDIQKESEVHHKRIHQVFNGLKPDRIPICEQVFSLSVASEIMGKEMLTGGTELHYREACAWMQGDSAHDEFVEQVYENVIELHHFFDYDILFMPWRMSRKPTKQLDENTFLYGDENTDDWSVYSFDPVSKSYGILEKPVFTYEKAVDIMRNQIIQLEKTDKPVVIPEMLLRFQQEYGSEFVVAGMSGMAIPMDAAWMEAVAFDPLLVKEWVDMQAEQNIRFIEAQAKVGFCLFNGGGDFAFNSGPIYSPAFFDEAMAPNWKRIFDRCRELGVYYVMRSDGNLWPIAENLFGRCRPHAYYEIDHDAGMTFKELRNSFPELVLFGNISCDLLQRGTPEAVKEATLECLNAASPRMAGASANAILHGTPPENVITLYETVKSFKP
jgi:hypothetical protein